MVLVINRKVVMSINNGPNKPYQQQSGYPVDTKALTTTNALISSEKEVILRGMTQPIKVKILSTTPLNESQMIASLERNAEKLAILVTELGISSPLSVEILEDGQIKNVILVEREPNDNEKVKIAKVLQNANLSLQTDKPKTPIQIKTENLRDIETQLKDINAKQKLDLSDDRIEQIAYGILLYGSRAAEMAKSQQKKVLVDTADAGVQIVATKTGKLHVKISFVGSGKFKDTQKFSKIGLLRDQSLEQLKQTQAKHSAVAVAKERQIPSGMGDNKALEVNAIEHQNEIALHLELTGVRKQAKKESRSDPLDNVATSIVISHVKPNSTEGIALMGKLFSGGDVDKRLREGNLTLAERAFVCSGFLNGVAQLHALNIVHRDIKSDNILLEVQERSLPAEEWPQDITPQNIPQVYSAEFDDHGSIKSVKKSEIIKVALCDLGKGSHIEPDRQLKTDSFLFYSHIVPPGLMTMNKAFSKEFDIYSSGRTAYQIFAGIPLNKLNGVDMDDPFRNKLKKEFDAVFDEIAKNEDPTKFADLNEKIHMLENDLLIWDKMSLGPPESWPNWNKIPPIVQAFIKRMVDIDHPENRPTAAECAEFFKKLTAEDLTPHTDVSGLHKTTADDKFKNIAGGYR